jgi:hypothetical protein
MPRLSPIAAASLPPVRAATTLQPVEARPESNRETQFELVQRRNREADERMRAFNAMCAERRAAGVLDALSSLDMPLSVGTFDGNGNAKGSGWGA